VEAIVSAALIATESSYMAVTIPFLVAGVYILQNVYLRTPRQLRFLDLEAESPVYSHFIETLEGISTIRAFGWQQKSSDINIKHLDQSQKPYYLLYRIRQWLNLVLDLIVAALAIIVTALAISLRSSSSAGLLGIAMNNILTFNRALAAVVTYWTQSV
jgi:ABC-type multidrug transport system fused ATPase/permease subunit